MKAAVIKKHGNPKGIQLQEVDKPKPGKNEILVKVMATTVTAGDAALRRQSFFQFLLVYPIARLFFGVKNQRKKILGHEFAGIVESTGKNVSRFRTGDYVFGTTGFKGGAHAQYISLPENSIMTNMPENMSFQQAAALPIGGICALHFLKQLNVMHGDKIMIYGASGSIGTYAVQLAKHFGAVVTSVCSKSNMEIVKSIGSDFLIDYNKDAKLFTGQKFDAIFDTVGKFSKNKAQKFLKENGRYISTHSSPVKEKQEYLDSIQKLAINNIIKPVIDSTYLFKDIRKAHTYVDTGRKKGNVIIKLT